MSYWDYDNDKPEHEKKMPKKKGKKSDSNYYEQLGNNFFAKWLS